MRLDERTSLPTTSPRRGVPGRAAGSRSAARPARRGGGGRGGGGRGSRSRRVAARTARGDRPSRPRRRERAFERHARGRRHPDRPDPPAISPLARGARRLAPHDPRLSHGRGLLPRVARRAGHRLDATVAARSCVATSPVSGQAPHARPSRSASRRSARSTAGRRARVWPPGDPWGAIATPRLPSRLPRVLEVDEVDRLLAVIDRELEAADAARTRTAPLWRLPWRCAIGPSSRSPMRRGCASASWRPRISVRSISGVARSG